MGTVQSVERALSILEVLSRRPAGVTDIATTTDLPKSTVARLLATLERRHAVARLPGDARYRLGPAVAELAAATTPTRNLIAVARPHLVDLTDAVGEAAGLSVPDGYDMHYIDQVEGPNPVQVRDWTGTRIPMHVVPSGLVLLATWPREAVKKYVGRDLARPTKRTVADPAGIRAKLATIRAQGHAWVMEEFAEGINSVAAPIHNEQGAPIAAVHVHGPAYRFPPERREARIARHVVEAARRISEQLGHDPD